MYNNEEEKKSSATAKTALGLAIGGLSLAAVQGGVLGDGYGTGGGLLGGLFGGRNGYTTEQLARGRQAETELAVIHQYMIPTWSEISDLKKEVAVNKAVDHKNQEINHLLFKRAEEQSACGFELNKMRTESAFALARQEQQCCCDKTNAKVDYLNALQEQRTASAFALANQKTDCNYDKLANEIECTYNRLDAKTNSAFAISNLETDAKLCEATRNLVRGEVYLSPASLADPYAAGTNVLMSRHVNRYSTGCGGWFNTGDCGCNGYGNWNW